MSEEGTILLSYGANDGSEEMTNSCGNCEYGECREEYLYPYRCKKEKAIRYSEEKWMDRVHRGYVCEKWELKKR